MKQRLGSPSAQYSQGQKSTQIQSASLEPVSLAKAQPGRLFHILLVCLIHLQQRIFCVSPKHGIILIILIIMIIIKEMVKLQ